MALSIVLPSFFSSKMPYAPSANYKQNVPLGATDFQTTLAKKTVFQIIEISSDLYLHKNMKNVYCVIQILLAL